MNLFQLPKESQLRKESQVVVGTGSIKDKEYHHDIINEIEVTESVNVVDNNFIQSKEAF